MLAIIGGTGLYQLEDIEILGEKVVDTPFGPPSAAIIEASYQSRRFLFLPRHGAQHALMPHEINYRANLFALKACGVKQILGVSAVGSLRENIAPGDLVTPDQYMDFIRGPREKSFFGSGVVAHVSTATPVCPQLADWICEHARQMNMAIHRDKTYACVDGPRLGTSAESHFLRMINCDVVGMTNVPEVFLAREAQLCYATIGIVTDYDCWKTDTSEHVTVADVIARYGESLKQVKQLLRQLLASDMPKPDEAYRRALDHALLTPPDKLSDQQRQWLSVLQQ